MSWSNASPPTEKVLATQSGTGWPLSDALKAARTANTVLIPYIVARPVRRRRRRHHHQEIMEARTKKDWHRVVGEDQEDITSTDEILLLK